MDTSDVVANTGKEIAPQQPALNVGLTLREAREHMGISVHDVAERIKFAPRQVEALEANDFAHLPQATFLRGFVRSYARMLQLDETALIAALPGGEPARQAAAKAPQTAEVAFPAIRSLQRVNLTWLAGAVAVALVLVLFALLHDGEPVARPAVTVVEPVPLPAPEAAVSAVSAVEAIQPEATEPAKVAESKKAPEPVKARPPVVMPAPRIAAASAPAETAKPAVPLESLRLRPMHFVFGESTWVEVVDANGAVLLSKTNPRGSEQWIGGPRRAPYEVTIAHPGNVRLYYKGKEIDLSPYAGMDTARLKVE